MKRLLACVLLGALGVYVVRQSRPRYVLTGRSTDAANSRIDRDSLAAAWADFFRQSRREVV